MIYDSYLVEDDIPDNHFWGDVDGKNWLTPHKNQVSFYVAIIYAHIMCTLQRLQLILSLTSRTLYNLIIIQHIPHYCGSCWAHGAISSLMDRIKIAQKGKGTDINLSIQYILNCGAESAGSCHGG